MPEIPQQRIDPARWSAWAIIKEARNHAQLTQTELAQKVGTSASQISRYERAVVLPGIDTLTRIVEECGMYIQLKLSEHPDSERLSSTRLSLSVEQRIHSASSYASFVTQIRNCVNIKHMSDPNAPELSTKDIIATLAEHKVDYIIIGGIAAMAHGSNRVTLDFDITPQWVSDNFDRLAAALISMDAKLRAEGGSPDSRVIVDFPISGESLTQFEVSTWRTKYGDFDVVSGTPTRHGALSDYDDLLPRAQQETFFGMAIWVISLDDLIESKRALRRDHDINSLPELYRLKERNNRDT